LQICAEKIGDGEDLFASGTLAAEVQLAAHEIAFVASSFADNAVLAGRAFVDRLGDQTLLPTQAGGKVGESRSVRLMAAESVGSLAAGWATIDAAALDRKGTATHWTRPQLELVIVTPIVTRGYRAHAPTARARVAVRACSKTN
jgi:hypothetical protein